MVVLAQALVSHPRFVIIDELSLGLAPVIINRLIPTIRSVAESGAGVLLIEQFATVALGLANRAYIMEGGRIQFSGMASELQGEPGAASVRVPVADPQRRGHRSGGDGRRAAPHMSVTAIEHVLVLSDDIERTRDFYCEVIGLEVGDRPPLEFPGYWLYAGATACVHIAERRPYAAHAARLGLEVPERDPGVGPVDHIAFNAGDYDALTRAARALRGRRGDQHRAGGTPPGVHRGPQRRARRDQREELRMSIRTTPPFCGRSEG